MTKDLVLCQNLIRLSITKAELLAQLAEEAAELAHAALKLRRAEGDLNPTPVSCDEAAEGLVEEVADVLLLLSVLDIFSEQDHIDYIKSVKLRRWVERIKSKKGG